MAPEVAALKLTPANIRESKPEASAGVGEPFVALR
jgi:hypothetical protein